MGSDNEEESGSQNGTAGMLDKFRSMDIVNYIGVEDFADELSYKWTSFLLSGLCSLITMKTYFMHPVSCFVPNPIGFAVENQNEYVNNYCWTEGTYAVHPLNFSLSAEIHDGGISTYEDNKIVYYQWVPFVLALQAVLFYLPRLLWHMVSYDKAGTDIGHVVRVAQDASRECGERHDKMVNHACRMLDQMLQRSCAKSLRGKDPIRGAFHSAWHVVSVAMPAKLSGSWLILMYLVIKLTYLGNVLAQLSLMRTFLGIESSRYDMLGAMLLWDVANGRDWQITGAFPRVGCCAIYVRTAATGTWQFAQCILPVNMINEKVYTFLWFWFVFVSIATLISLITWLVRVCKTSCGNHFVNRMLKLADNYQEAKDNDYVKSFCRLFLRRDGTFVLKMIALNCGDIICSEIVQKLWNLYRRSRDLQHSECDLSSGLLVLKCDSDTAISSGGGNGLKQRKIATATAPVLEEPEPGSDAFKNATAPCIDDDEVFDSTAMVNETKKL